MQSWFSGWLARGVGAGVALVSVLAEGEGTPIALRYHFNPAQTNAYRVTFQATVQDQALALAGVIWVEVRGVEEGVATLGFRGLLMPRSPGPDSMRRPPRVGPGPAQRLHPVHLSAQTEVRVDALGRVVQDTGLGGELPLPFGNPRLLFFEPVPGESSDGWTASSELWVPEGVPPWGGGYGMDSYAPEGYPGRPGPRLAVTRTVSCRWESVTDETATWTKRLELVSWLTTGDAPRLQAGVEGKVVFDRELGWLRRARFEGLAVSTTATLTERRPMTLEVVLLTEEEAARELEALAPRPPEPPPLVTGEELPRLLAELEVRDETTRMMAINRLRMAEIEVATPELRAAAVRLAQSADYGARATGARLLGRYGTAEEMPAMLQVLRGTGFGDHRELLDRIHQLKDPRAIEVLVEVLARGAGDLQSVRGVLRGYGAAAEPAVLALFAQRHVETRRLACEILGEIGSERSVEALREQMLDPDQQVSQTAATALRAVTQRLATRGAGAG